ncbi:MAG: hypothetical protein WBA74_13725, partial [Cyclobacteriaceae bacterium]
MKLRLILLFVILTHFSVNAQIVTISPADASLDDEITITYDATLGNPAGLIGADKVYMHSGVVTENLELPSGEDWQNVVGNWGEDDGIGEMTKVEGETDKWQITLSPDARSYYGLGENDEAFYLAMVFRNADGSAEGKGTNGDFGFGVVNNGDIFVRLDAGNFIFFSDLDDNYFEEEGNIINFSAKTSSAADTVVAYVTLPNGSKLPLGNSLAPGQTELSFDYTVAVEGLHEFFAYALIGDDSVAADKEVNINLLPELVQVPIPAGLKQGVNYNEADPTKATFVLLAPGKEFVYIAGTMNEWRTSSEYLMNQDTENPELFWLELTGLEAGKEYIYQYWVDGQIIIGDPYGTKVADPWNDGFIPETVYPNLISFTDRDRGIATTFQTGQQEFVWDASEETWQRPDQQDLIVYELLV